MEYWKSCQRKECPFLVGELKLEPPVNRVIPVGRSHLRALWAAYGEL
ncbi:MAG: hypothetical protein ABFS37_11800 [Acidobacteriota bacterium]